MTSSVSSLLLFLASTSQLRLAYPHHPPVELTPVHLGYRHLGGRPINEGDESISLILFLFLFDGDEDVGQLTKGLEFPADTRHAGGIVQVANVEGGYFHGIQILCVCCFVLFCFVLFCEHFSLSKNGCSCA